MSNLERLRTVTVELEYDDALRLWLLVHDPANAREHRADERIRKLVNDAIAVVEEQYTDDPAAPARGEETA